MFRFVFRLGVSVSLGFYHDVFIPEQYMQSPGSFYNAGKRQWLWKYDDQELWLERGEKVRFKVREVRFQRVPTPTEASKLISTLPGTSRVSRKYQWNRPERPVRVSLKIVLFRHRLDFLSLRHRKIVSMLNRL